uniref:Uncharacterized protein n=1 Tax=Rhipicephalus zambeziensis TaxID=60191 RepID=A0A224YA42_9ACAR
MLVAQAPPVANKHCLAVQPAQGPFPAALFGFCRCSGLVRLGGISGRSGGLLLGHVWHCAHARRSLTCLPIQQAKYNTLCTRK